MRHIDFTALRLSDIELFLSISRLKSFTKAAAELHHTQSYVSKHVAELERALGLQLFIRRNNSIQLSPAGKVLFQRWGDIHQRIVDSLQEAHSAQAGYRHRLRIGCVDWNDFSFIEKIKQFAETNTDAEITTEELSFRELREKFSASELDVVFTTNYESIGDDVEGSSRTEVSSGYLVAVVNESHRLAERESITPQDLRNEDMLMLNESEAPYYLRMILKLCSQGNFAPKVAAYANSGKAHLQNVAMNRGIFISTNFFIGVQDFKFIRQIPIAGSRAAMMMVWRSDENNEVLNRFISSLCVKIT